jgi:hypothetical protein
VSEPGLAAFCTACSHDAVAPRGDQASMNKVSILIVVDRRLMDELGRWAWATAFSMAFSLRTAVAGQKAGPHL